MNWKIKVILILLTVFVGARAYLAYVDWSNGQARKEANRIFENTVRKSTPEKKVLNKEIETPILPKNNAKILGKIEINALHLSYVILDGATKKNMAVSITKVTGPEIHGQGNLVLAGHYMRNGTLFGKLRFLKIHDIIRLEDLQGITKEYEIYKKDIVEPTNLSPLKQNLDEKPTVTLISCTKDGSKRIIFYARLKS